MRNEADSGAPDRADVVDACAQLQEELESLIGGLDSQSAAQSLDTAIASLKDVERENVSTVQLVALS
jgi:hypothetical protein